MSENRAILVVFSQSSTIIACRQNYSITSNNVNISLTVEISEIDLDNFFIYNTRHFDSDKSKICLIKVKNQLIEICMYLYFIELYIL